MEDFMELDQQNSVSSIQALVKVYLHVQVCSDYDNFGLLREI